MIHIWCRRRQGGKMAKLMDLLNELEENEKSVIVVQNKPRAFHISSSLAVDGYNSAALTGEDEMDKTIIR